MYRDSCTVRCEFSIMDTISQQNFLIGFPLIRSEFLDYRVIPSNLVVDKWRGDTSSFKLKCYVDDVELPYDLIVDTTHSYGPFNATIWGLFKTKLNSGIPRKVVVEYTDHWFYSSYYYIGTGALWSKAIESGRIVFDHSHIASTNFVTRTEEEDLRCPRDSVTGKTVQRFKDSLVYILKNYRPEADETVKISMFRFWSESIAPDFMDTLKIRTMMNGPQYGKIADFRYRFLWDTLTYVHKSNLVAIRDELLKICRLECLSGSNDTDSCRPTDCYLYNEDESKYYRDSVSFREKSLLNILSGRIDKLREEHELEQKLQQKITIKSYFFN